MNTLQLTARWLTAVPGLLAAAATSAQGYFDFESIPGLGDDARVKVQIDLNRQMVNFVLDFLEEADETEAAAIVSGIEGVRLRVYDDIEDPDEVLEFIDDASGDLERDGWQRAVYVQDDEGRVRVYIRFEDTRMAGLTIMLAGHHSDEAIFFNVVGQIDPVTLGRLANSMGVGDHIRPVDRDDAE